MPKKLPTESQALLNLISGRLEHLTKALPRIERILEQLEQAIAEKSLDRTTFPNLVEFYTQIFPYYHKALDVVWKILDRGVAEGLSDEEKGVLLKYNALDKEERKQLHSLIDVMLDARGIE